jgi:Uma2 family endonuclease
LFANNQKKFLDFPPDLVVESLLEATHLKDRNVKYPKYEEAGVPYYLIVDADAKAVEVYQLTNSRYQRQLLDQHKPYEFVMGNCRFEMVFNRIGE